MTEKVSKEVALEDRVGDCLEKKEFPDDVCPGLFRANGFYHNDFFWTLLNAMRQKVTFDARDCFVASYPKSGTTWTLQIVDLLRSNGDFDRATRIILDERCLMLEAPPPWPVTVDSYDQIAPPPRVWKTHLTPSVMPDSFSTLKPKIVFVYRNTKDAIVSGFYHYRALVQTLYEGSMTNFIDQFIAGRMLFGPYTKHMKEWVTYAKANPESVFMLNYEKMSADRIGYIRKLNDFLGTDVSEETMQEIQKRSSFEHMKQDPASNYEWAEKEGFFDKTKNRFMRKGVVGDWRNHFSETDQQRVDAWIKTEFEQFGTDFVNELLGN